MRTVAKVVAILALLVAFAAAGSLDGGPDEHRTTITEGSTP